VCAVRRVCYVGDVDPVLTSSTIGADPISERVALTVLGMFFAGLAFWVAVGRQGRQNENDLPPDENAQSQASAPGASPEEWDALCARAGAVVEQAIAELPPDVAAVANQIPCLFKEYAEKETPGYRTMGVFQHFTAGKKSDYNGPIVLYLKSMEELCARRSKTFEDQVRYTYLHELGHGLGWDEVDLARHGLPSGKPPKGI